MEKITEFTPGQTFILPEYRLTEEEIIAFAHAFDPQYIHIDKEFAAKSVFGGIIASGLHPYITLHREWWAPRVRDKFICGVSIDGAEFKKPIYANEPFSGRLTILSTEPKPHKNSVIVRWQMEILSEAGEAVHYVKYSSYHQL